MKRCSQCGTEVPDDLAVFCPNCGSTFAPSGVGLSTPPMSETSPPEAPLAIEKIPFLWKLLRAARLDSTIYDSIKQESGAFRQAFAAIVILNMITGFALGVNDFLSGPTYPRLGSLEIPALVGAQIAIALVKWSLLAFLVYVFGVRILKAASSLKGIASAVAFAYAPIALQILLAFTASSYDLTTIIIRITDLWVIVALVVAVAQTLDVSLNKALGIIVLIGVFYLPVSILLIV